MSNNQKDVGTGVMNKLAKLVSGILAHLGVDIGDQGSKTIAQAMGFAVVGFTNTVVSYLLYAGSLLALRAVGLFGSWDYIAAQGISFVLSVLWSYWWNSRLVFGARGWKALLRTYVSYSFTGLFLGSVLLVLWVQLFHVSEFVAPILNLLITVPLNFVLNKFWAFKK